WEILAASKSPLVLGLSASPRVIPMLQSHPVTSGYRRFELWRAYAALHHPDAHACMTTLENWAAAIPHISQAEEDAFYADLDSASDDDWDVFMEQQGASDIRNEAAEFHGGVCGIHKQPSEILSIAQAHELADQPMFPFQRAENRTPGKGRRWQKPAYFFDPK